MNINQLYTFGISSNKLSFILNPLRRVIFKLVRPYLCEVLHQNQILAEKIEILHAKQSKTSRNYVEVELMAIKNRYEDIYSKVENVSLLNSHLNALTVEVQDNYKQFLSSKKDIENHFNNSLLITLVKGYLFAVKPGELISEHFLKFGEWDGHILEQAGKVNNHKERIAIDIGAHIGTTTIPLSKLFKEVHSFEPNDYNYNILSFNKFISNSDNVILHNDALSYKKTILSLGKEEQQEVPIAFSNNTFLGSKSNNLGAYCFTNDGSGVFSKEAATLDSLGYENVGFIKIDVQGADLDVLIGSLDTIKRCRPTVIFEWEEELAKNFDNNNLHEVIAVIEGLNYEVKVLKEHNAKQKDYICLPK
ncbi:hypothetical protein VCSRO206_2815 [Vibrio cholerae]|nr:putative nucleotide sugar biosynthesis protein [Vibrio cholerae]GHX57858.1 hypothetical protein VCSRO206_2815 [Vibrio cholerae]